MDAACGSARSSSRQQAIHWLCSQSEAFLLDSYMSCTAVDKNGAMLTCGTYDPKLISGRRDHDQPFPHLFLYAVRYHHLRLPQRRQLDRTNLR